VARTAVYNRGRAPVQRAGSVARSYCRRRTWSHSFDIEPAAADERPHVVAELTLSSRHHGQSSSLTSAMSTAGVTARIVDPDTHIRHWTIEVMCHLAVRAASSAPSPACHVINSVALEASLSNRARPATCSDPADRLRAALRIEVPRPLYGNRLRPAAMLGQPCPVAIISYDRESRSGLGCRRRVDGEWSRPRGAMSQRHGRRRDHAKRLDLPVLRAAACRAWRVRLLHTSSASTSASTAGRDELCALRPSARPAEACE
jgi:hypothetical protein